MKTEATPGGRPGLDRMSSREAHLTALLARTSLDAGQRAEARNLVSQPLDWEHLMRLAERHGLAPLFERHLGSVGVGRVPKRVLARLWVRAEARSRRNAAMAAELAAIVRLLDGQGIETVPYKGPTLALRAYGDVALREFGDLDLLVRARDVLKAKSILAARGFAPITPLGQDQEEALVASRVHYELALERYAPAMIVELHWRSDPTVDVPPLDDDDWWKSLPRTTVDGLSVRCLAASELVLILCLHGSKHSWCSLGWLVDVVELLQREPDVDWEWIAASARTHRCERRLALGLLLARELLGANVPEMPRFQDPAVRRIADAIRADAFAIEPRPNSLWRGLEATMALHDSIPHAMAFAMRLALTPGWGEWARWRLPRPLFALYWFLRPLRLFGKYVLRMRPREAGLAPRLVHGHGHGVGEVEAPVPGTHRQA